MKSFLRKSALLLMLLSSFNVVTAQSIPFENEGIFVGCDGVIYDTGGVAGSYGNNENITFTICPDFDAGESQITLDFLTFNLGAGDYMNVHQGFNTLFPLQGTYSGTDLNGDFVTTAVDNFTGCITLQFVSDGSDVGEFVIFVSCGPPCIRPIAVVDAGGPNPIRICVDELVTLDGNPTIFAPGTSLDTYTWNFGDGTTDSSSGMVVSHSYNEPGEYRVQLSVFDNTGCKSINFTDVQIQVGTTPSFEGSSTNLEICLGQEIDLLGVVAGTTWATGVDTFGGGEMPLPDGNAVCYDSEVMITNFLPGQTLTSINDLFSLQVEVYHTFMFDLQINIECPSGQSVTLHNQMQQPNGPAVGSNSIDFGFPGQQQCSTYEWTPNATQTMSQVGTSLLGTGSLPEDQYMSLEPLDGLLGCELNGTWTFSICDMWLSDSGFMCSWQLNLNPALFPENVSFTPVYGAACDSSFWSGPFITSTAPDCNNITVQPTSLGLHSYTYSATDNHGCTYEHTAVVNVVQGPLAAVVNSELSFCGDPVQMSAFVSNPTPGANYNFVWTPSTGLSNPNAANTFVNSLSGTQTYTVFVYQTGAEVCGSEASVTVTYIPPAFSSVTALICQGETYTLPDGTTQTQSGVYPVTIQSVVTGCDSIVTTTLSVFPVSVENVSETLCGGQPIPLPDGSLATSGGVYTTVLTSQVSGCDSTIVTTVTEVVVNPGQYPAICDDNFVVTLNGTSTPSGGNLTWSGPAGITFSNPNSGISNATNTSGTGGTFNISLTDNRCPNNSVSTQLIMRTPVNVSFNPVPQLCLEETYQLTAQVSGSSATPYVWSDPLDFYEDENGSSVILNANNIGVTEEYEISVFVPGQSPCPSATATVLVEVIDCNYLIPNIFTPNGDDMNGVFRIQGIENFPGSKMVIYNRWGKVVYESDNYGFPTHSGFWNGTHYKSGRRVDDGVYFYELVLSKLSRIEKGTVTVLSN